jgi:hypothetical protein
MFFTEILPEYLLVRNGRRDAVLPGCEQSSTLIYTSFWLYERAVLHNTGSQEQNYVPVIQSQKIAPVG